MIKRKELVAKRLKELRKEHHYTMEMLADKIGVTKSAISKWESGLVENMRQDSITALANLYNVSPGYLMGYEENDHLDINTENKNLQLLLKKTENMNDMQLAQLMAYAQALLDIQGSSD